MEKLLKRCRGTPRVVSPEISRSQYSLVSCGELTTEALQLWYGLPEEVKYDPALAQFRQYYEKEHGNLPKTTQGKTPRHNAPKKRLPAVNSAPILITSLQISSDEGSVDLPVDGGENGGVKSSRHNDRTSDKNKGCGSRKMAMALYYAKMTILVGIWLFFTIVFMLYNEKLNVQRQSSIVFGEVKGYPLPRSKSSSIQIEIFGPFLSQQEEYHLNSSQHSIAPKMEVWIERRAAKASLNGSRGEVDDVDVLEKSSTTLILHSEEQLDFMPGEKRKIRLALKPSDAVIDGSHQEVYLRMRTSSNISVPFMFSYMMDPIDVSTGLLYALALLCGLYVLIIFEIINRALAAVFISTLSLCCLSLVGERPSLEEVISWLDVETLLLLFSMMLLVGVIAETGMFDYLAVYIFEVTKGKTWPLINLLCAITAILSTCLDNVTTVLLMAPVTIRLCEVMQLAPIPVLMALVLYSNIGGTATPVGDPPNVIIASNKQVVEAGINFTNFTLHMTLGIVLVAVQTYFQLRFMYRKPKTLYLQPETKEAQDLRNQIAVWRRAADSLVHLSKSNHVIREKLERKIEKLSAKLEVIKTSKTARVPPKETFEMALTELKSKYKIRDMELLVKAIIATTFVVIVFFLHSIPELKRISLGWTALLGAILLLILADRDNLESIMNRVEWSTLLFFASLFVLMEALSKFGLIDFIGGMTEAVIMSVHEKARLGVACLLILWVSGITSAFVDNIPLTTMMVRVVTSLAANRALDLPLQPLVWALSFGACLGGNGTLIGASANVVCAGVAEQHGYKFTFVSFFKVGFPIMIGHLIMASLYLVFCHCVVNWH